MSRALAKNNGTNSCTLVDFFFADIEKNKKKIKGVAIEIKQKYRWIGVYLYVCVNLYCVMYVLKRGDILIRLMKK